MPNEPVSKIQKSASQKTNRKSALHIHYDAEVYPKNYALVNLARKLDTYNE